MVDEVLGVGGHVGRDVVEANLGGLGVNDQRFWLFLGPSRKVPEISNIDVPFSSYAILEGKGMGDDGFVIEGEGNLASLA